MCVIVAYIRAMRTIMKLTQANYRPSRAANGVLVPELADKDTVDAAGHDCQATRGRPLW